MLYYVVVVLLVLLLNYFISRPECATNGVVVRRVQNFRAMFLILLPLTLLAIFRWDVGVDSAYGNSYWNCYRASADGINRMDFEPGFYWFMRIFAELEIPFFWFLFVHGLIFAFCASYGIYKGSKWVTWSIAVFFLSTFYFDSYSSLRQSIAEAICLIGWAKVTDEDNTRYKDLWIVGIFLVAGFFHSIAWMNIPIYYLSKLHFRSSRDVLLFAIIAVALTPVLQRVVSAAMQFFAGGKYTVEGVARINIIVTGTLFLLCWIRYDAICALDKDGYRLVNLALISFILILNSGALYLPYRVYDMLKIGYVLIVPHIIRSIDNGKGRFLAGLFVAAIFVLTFLNFYAHHDYIANYQTALSDWIRIVNLP